MRLFASVWIVPAAVLPIIGAILAWSAYDEYRQALDQEYRFLEAHARIVDGELSGMLRNIRQFLTRIAEERPGLSPSRLDAYEKTLIERKQDFPEIRTLAVTGPDGRVELTANPSVRGFDGSKRDYFVAHREGPLTTNFHITRPFKSSFGDYSIAFSVGIYDEAQRFKGVVVAGVNYKFFESKLAPLKPEGAGMLGLFNDKGDVLFRLPDPERHVGANVANGKPFLQFMRSGKRTTRSIGVAAIDGVERIYVHRAIGDTKLGIAVARPLSEVLAGWRGNLLLRALIFVFAAAVTVALAWIAHRRQREAVAGEEFLDQVIETANVMVISLDARGAVLMFNGAAEEVSGYRREEILGRDWFETVMPRERYPNAWEAFLQYRDAAMFPRTIETRILTKSGTERRIAWQNSEIRTRGTLVATMSFGIDITERRNLEAAKRNEEISRRLVLMQEEERRRLAIELHDRTSPNLSALGMNLGVIARTLSARASAKLRHVLQDAFALLEDTIASVRSISTDFRPSVLDHAGLWPALESYAQQFSRRTGIPVHAESSFEGRLAPHVETNLFRIAQEALTNCAKHSQANAIRIRHVRRGDAVALVIADDGIGFDPAVLQQAGDKDGHGLVTMRWRAEFMGGSFVLDARPGRGTRVAVEIPAAHAAGREVSCASARSGSP